MKSQAGRRKVPIPAILRDYLVKHRMRSDRRDSALIFGNTATTPFTPNMLQRRADQVWAEAGLERITPHSCRHTFASLMIAAEMNAKALSTLMGHAKIGITLDRYGHLMTGSEEEAASLLDSYLDAERQGAEDAAGSAGAVQNECLTGEQTGNNWRTETEAPPFAAVLEHVDGGEDDDPHCPVMASLSEVSLVLNNEVVGPIHALGLGVGVIVPISR